MPLSNEIKEAALVGLRHRRDELGAQIAELERELRGDQESEPAPRKRRRMSAAGRKRIAEAQRKRWAALHAEQRAAAAKGTAKKRPRSRR
jgi:hypothetical protein